MTTRRDRSSKETDRAYYLFLFGAGVLAIGVSLFVKHTPHDLLLNVGATLVCSAVLAFMYQRFGANEIKHQLESLKSGFNLLLKSGEVGVRDIWTARRDIPNTMWNDFTRDARGQVWLFGIAELGYADDPSFRAIVAAGAKRGCRYRILLLDPDSPVASEVDRREGGGGQVQGRIRRAIAQFGALLELPASRGGSVELRLTVATPQVSIVRADDEMLVTPYISFNNGNSCFTMRLGAVASGAFERYEAHFEGVWAEAVPHDRRSSVT